jgi:hypothetical protein
MKPEGSLPHLQVPSPDPILSQINPVHVPPHPNSRKLNLLIQNNSSRIAGTWENIFVGKGVHRDAASTLPFTLPLPFFPC